MTNFRLDYREGATTKAQRREMERLQAWLNGEPFRESNRQKAADMRVPQFTPEEVLETYIPPAAKSSAQYFTPLSMTSYLYNKISSWGFSPGEKILDPCAGIGNLFHNLDEGADITAIELEMECVEIGKVLFPRVNWLQGTAFEYIDLVEGQYDTVIMNPPFGSIARGTHGADVLSQVKPFPSGAQYQFLELAIRALKQGGRAIVISPYNLLLKMPKSFERWFHENAMEEVNFGPLPGKFKLTGVTVYGYVLVRTSPVTVGQAETPVVAPATGANQKEEAQPSTGKTGQMSLFDL